MTDGLYAAERLWPDFRVVDDLVYFAWCAPEATETTHDRDTLFDRTGLEALLNHVHILDCFSQDAGLPDEPWWNQNHPDFKAACAFGKRWAEAVASKLRRDFPERSFFVYYTEQDNPIVRFHQEHPGEIPYMSADRWADEIATGGVVIHYVRGRGNDE